jgi:hypothetical protein
MASAVWVWQRADKLRHAVRSGSCSSHQAVLEIASEAKVRLHASGSLGNVAFSNFVKYSSASSRLVPHISGMGRRLAHTAGRPGLPKSAQRRSGSN